MDKRTILADSQAVIRDLQQTPILFEPDKYAERAKAQDLLEFHVLDALAGIDGEVTTLDRAEYEHIRREADALHDQLERVDSELIECIRASIRSGQCTGETLWKALENCLGPLRGARLEIGSAYDYRDDFIHRLLHVETSVIPQETRARDERMVSYQPTPARVLFKLLEWVSVKPGDVFYDLGSGLGHVAIMVRLLTGATVKGIEFEPTYCSYARQCARELHLQHIVFLDEDARSSDYSDGTVFYLYTPFRGHLLQEVLDRLRDQARHRRITICTYGPCTLQVNDADWVATIKLYKDWQSGLGVFQAGPLLEPELPH